MKSSPSAPTSVEISRAVALSGASATWTIGKPGHGDVELGTIRIQIEFRAVVRPSGIHDPVLQRRSPCSRRIGSVALRCPGLDRWHRRAQTFTVMLGGKRQAAVAADGDKILGFDAVCIVAQVVQETATSPLLGSTAMLGKN